MIPTYVVIPVERGQRAEMTARLVQQLGNVPIRLDDSDWSITKKWNHGLDWAAEWASGCPRYKESFYQYNVAFLNNDVEVGPGFLERLAKGLRSDDSNWISYPILCLEAGVYVVVNPDFANQTMTGWAFMLRGEAGLRFDEQFAWWYGDSDLEKQVRQAGKLVVGVGGCDCRHLDPMRSTMRPDLLALARRDEARFAAKWGLNPACLWLTQNPDFGKSA